MSILNREEADLFYKILNELIYFSNLRFKIIDNFSKPNEGNWDIYDIGRIIDKIFSKPEIITFSPGFTCVQYLTANCASFLVLKSIFIQKSQAISFHHRKYFFFKILGVFKNYCSLFLYFFLFILTFSLKSLIFSASFSRKPSS